MNYLDEAKETLYRVLGTPIYLGYGDVTFSVKFNNNVCNIIIKNEDGITIKQFNISYKVDDYDCDKFKMNNIVECVVKEVQKEAYQ